jgi:activator of 2-hydroxyglutaryl-CoA dehydratase
MVNRLGLSEKVMFCGGVARNSGIMKQFEKILGVKIVLPDDVDRVGAVGAALMAKKSCPSG